MQDCDVDFEQDCIHLPLLFFHGTDSYTENLTRKRNWEEKGECEELWKGECEEEKASLCDELTGFTVCSS